MRWFIRAVLFPCSALALGQLMIILPTALDLPVMVRVGPTLAGSFVIAWAMTGDFFRVRP